MFKRLSLIFSVVVSFSTHAAFITNQSILETGVDYTYFSIDNDSVVELQTLDALFDPEMFVFTNTGTLSADSLVGHDDDAGTAALSYYNSYLRLNLTQGDYVIAVGDFSLSLDEVLAGVADINATFTTPTYSLSMVADSASLTYRKSYAVTAPASLSLLALNAGMLWFRRRRIKPASR